MFKKGYLYKFDKNLIELCKEDWEWPSLAHGRIVEVLSDNIGRIDIEFVMSICHLSIRPGWCVEIPSKTVKYIKRCRNRNKLRKKNGVK